MATIRVSGTGNNISFEEKKKVLIRRQSNGIFIQTDKPIYNPGQQGKRYTDGIRQKAGETAACLERGFWCGGRPVNKACRRGRSGRKEHRGVKCMLCHVSRRAVGGVATL